MTDTARYYWCTITYRRSDGRSGSANLGPWPTTPDEVLDTVYFAEGERPSQLIGLPTAKERDELQHFLLTAPIKAVEARWEEMRPRYESREVAVINVGGVTP
jgi:hypothetical protein